MQSCAHVYPQGLLDLDIFLLGACALGTHALCSFFSSTCLPTHALGTCVLCLFCLSTNTRSFYFSEYEILTVELVNPKYWNRSWLAPFLGHDLTRNHPPKKANYFRVPFITCCHTVTLPRFKPPCLCDMY